jgi:hypothetical protein
VKRHKSEVRYWILNAGELIALGKEHSAKHSYYLITHYLIILATQMANGRLVCRNLGVGGGQKWGMTLRREDAVSQ